MICIYPCHQTLATIFAQSKRVLLYSLYFSKWHAYMVYLNPLLRSAENYVGVSMKVHMIPYSATSKRKYAGDPDVGAVDRHRFKFGTDTQEIHSR